jgi:signal transduction histidine kinase/DNA-binding response OmpR family regulator/ligand-binding sensor domain-containing protein
MSKIYFPLFSIVNILLLFICSDLWAGNGNRVFYNIGDIHGVSVLGANSVCEDDNGFIWVSSKSGVFRFTEDDERQYELPYVTANVISVNLLFRNSRLFAYTNNGQFFEYNSVYDRFDFVFDLRVSLGNDRLVVSDVLLCDDSSFYIAATFGLYKYSDKKGVKLITETNEKDHFIERYDDEYFFHGHAGELYLVDSSTGEKDHLFAINSDTRPEISQLYFHSKTGQLWIGTTLGRIYYYDVRFDRLVAVDIDHLPSQPAIAIEANTDSTIMLGYDGHGLWELDRKGTKVLNIHREDVDNPQSLNGNGVYDIFKDDKNRIWVCTFSGGVSFFEQTPQSIRHIKHQINMPNSLVNDFINDVFEDSNGDIWFATNNGLSKWEVKQDRWNNFFYENKPGESRVFLSIAEDDKGRIWAGTWESGVFLFDRDSGREFKRFDNLGNCVFDIRNDEDGNVWIAGIVENIVRYNVETDEASKFETQPVYVVDEYSDNNMLMGVPYGLISVNKKDGAVDVLMDGYIVHDFLLDGEIVWCATSGRGLVKFNLEERFVEDEFTAVDGLSSNFVNSITRVGDCLFLGTEEGLCRFSPKEGKTFSYSSNLPLANIVFNQDAGIMLSSGELVLGTNQGILMFDPEEIEEKNNLTGKIFFQDILIAGRTIRDSSIYDLAVPVDSLREIVLPYHKNTLTVELLPVGASEPHTKLSWKLKGLGETWSKPALNRMFSFANLADGEYELKVRMFNNSLSDVIDERSLIIVIKPAFWSTLWFYLLLVVFVVGVLYFIFRYHLNLIQQLHSREKIRFFTNAAHELRTSLTLISGPFEEITRESGFSPRARHFISLANEQVKSLLNAASQLIDFQKIDRGKAQVNLRMANITQLVEHRVMMFESFAQQRNIDLSVVSNDTEFSSGVDAGMIEKVVDNLLSNAIKYSHEDGKVKVEIWHNRRFWFLRVTDNGIGISIKGQKQLFKEFYRSENAINSGVVGSGIGMLMVKNYTEMHGGKVRFASKENEGSVFTIEIPAKKVTRYTPDTEEELDHLHESYMLSDVSAHHGVGTGKSSDSKLMTILIVEDHEKLRNFLELSMSEDYNVLTASDGLEALTLVQEKHPDIVISDIMMPKMDGFQLCKRIKSDFETSHTPVVLLTAFSTKALQLKGLGLGADAYLAKPFDMNLLKGRIRSIVLNRKAVRDKALKIVDFKSETPLFNNELNDKFIKRALEVVKSNITNLKFGKEEFASARNVSPSLLYKKVKTLTDQSPSDFIRSVRLNYALELLRSGAHNVTEVSEKTGFTSVAYFSYAFKKYYGKSPTDVMGD